MTRRSTLLERYLRDITPGKRGHESESYRINAMMRSPLAKMSVDRLDRGVFVQWRDARVLQVSNDTVRREMNLLSSIFSFARTEWSVPLANPLEKVRRPKQGHPFPRALAPRSCRAIASASHVVGRAPTGTRAR